jgi:hypothetical protein
MRDVDDKVSPRVWILALASVALACSSDALAPEPATAGGGEPPSWGQNDSSAGASGSLGGQRSSRADAGAGTGAGASAAGGTAVAGTPAGGAHTSDGTPGAGGGTNDGTGAQGDTGDGQGGGRTGDGLCG